MALYKNTSLLNFHLTSYPLLKLLTELFFLNDLFIIIYKLFRTTCNWFIIIYNLCTILYIILGIIKSLYDSLAHNLFHVRIICSKKEGFILTEFLHIQTGHICYAVKVSMQFTLVSKNFRTVNFFNQTFYQNELN